jgi:hypothetical protein
MIFKYKRRLESCVKPFSLISKRRRWPSLERCRHDLHMSTRTSRSVVLARVDTRTTGNRGDRGRGRGLHSVKIPHSTPSHYCASFVSYCDLLSTSSQTHLLTCASTHRDCLLLVVRLMTLASAPLHSFGMRSSYVHTHMLFTDQKSLITDKTHNSLKVSTFPSSFLSLIAPLVSNR